MFKFTKFIKQLTQHSTVFTFIVLNLLAISHFSARSLENCFAQYASNESQLSDFDKALYSYQRSLPRISKSKPIADAIIEFLMQFINKEKVLTYQGHAQLREKINEYVLQNKRIKMLLPGFPFKSTNHYKKCISHLPDLGEYLAFLTLNHICNEIHQVYEPGASITIVSDGFGYKTAVDDSEANVFDYYFANKRLMEQFSYLELYPWQIDLNIKSVAELIDTVAKESGNTSVDSNSAEYRGLIAFYQKELDCKEWDAILHGKAAQIVNEDLVPKELKPKQKEQLIRAEKNKLKKHIIQEVVKEGLLGKANFSKFIRDKIPNYDEYIRLSVHCNEADISKKLGISLIFGLVGTPWHNTICLENGIFVYKPQNEPINQGQVRYCESANSRFPYICP